MATYFREVKSIFLKAIIACLLTFIFVSQLFGLYAKEGDPCCDSNVCGFGYTCIAPKPCNLAKNPGSCTKSIIECPNGYGCPAGMYCVDYVCVGFGPGTPTPGGERTRPRMRHEFANSWTLAARNCAIIFATARS